MKEKYLFVPPKPKFTNKVIDKKELKKLMSWAFSNYGTGRASYMADKLKDLGFYYATRAGISLSIEDLKVPPSKRELLSITNKEIQFIEQKYTRGEITTVERFQKVIDTWNTASESLKDEVISYFKTTDPLNPIYIMAFSGARGNISQVRQLVGMRGLMADPQGQIIDLPIKSNFREGLTVTEYIISSYGARKGLVDTALRTADSGYLTRRLVDVAQDIIIREVDCGTITGIVLKDMIDNNKLLIPLETRLLGRVLFETLYSPDYANVVAHINEDLDYVMSKRILKTGIKSIVARSPLTCVSPRSVCQFCYGWNLAHGSLVDLGEAIGIIAAQSIGEPGTQLTMRTFHTGGVFTGEIATQIRAPFDGILRLPKSTRARIIRTRHGQEALSLEEGIKVDLFDYSGKLEKLELKQGTIVFLSDNEQFHKKQIIGEIIPRGSLMTERVTKDVSSSIEGEVCFSNLNIEKKIDRQGNITYLSSNGGLIWILSGNVYNLPPSSKIILEEGESVKQNSILAVHELTTEYGGTVRLSEDEIQIVTASTKIKDGIVVQSSEYNVFDSPYYLELENGSRFIMQCSPGNKISNSQIVAELENSDYKTSTGGIVRYNNLDIDENDKTKRGYEVKGNGSLLWIPEETHEINRDLSLLLVKDGDFITSGYEIIKDIYSKNEGYVKIIQENEIVREIIIKPGLLYSVNPNTFQLFKEGCVLRKGDLIYDDKIAEEDFFVEGIKKEDKSYILLRPLFEYKIQNKNDLISEIQKQNPNHSIQLNVIQRLMYKNEEKIKSVDGLDLVKTYLVLNFESSNLSADVEFLPESNSKYTLQFVVMENLGIRNTVFGETNSKITETVLCVSDGEIIKPNTVVAKSNLLCRTPGQIKRIETNKSSSIKILILTEENQKTIILDGKTPQVFEGELVRAGDQIAENVTASDSGQIIKLSSDSLTIRSGMPYLISTGAILQVNNQDLIDRSDTLAILVFERSKTGDIIQGLPKIEEILEARKPKEPCKLSQRPGKVRVNYEIEESVSVKIVEPNGNVLEYIPGPTQKIMVSNGEFVELADPITDGAPNPHEMLSIFFNFYKNLVPLYEAAKLSLQKLQVYLVNEVQNVYQSQSVDISDKHIEIIVKQMTSKVKVEDGGDTTLLPGELIDLLQLNNINEAMELTKGMPSTYYPVLLGITKSSLNTDSFISAASFQETTRVLAESAIEGKADWLRGLKENVIIGRLIPAGTGFTSYPETSKDIKFKKKIRNKEESFVLNNLNINNFDTEMINVIEQSDVTN
jgi:DNA-directed RNA polymerase subunit beta'